MSIVNAPRASDERSFRRTAPEFRPALETLEDRSVPTASLVSVANSGLDGADAPVQVLATSDDGNFMILQSTATNLVSGQIDVPGTMDLFWYSRISGKASLVSRRD